MKNLYLLPPPKNVRKHTVGRLSACIVATGCSVLGWVMWSFLESPDDMFTGALILAPITISAFMLAWPRR